MQVGGLDGWKKLHSSSLDLGDAARLLFIFSLSLFDETRGDTNGSTTSVHEAGGHIMFSSYGSKHIIH
jgi:hypothetical protein